MNSESSHRNRAVDVPGSSASSHPQLALIALLMAAPSSAITTLWIMQRASLSALMAVPTYAVLGAAFLVLYIVLFSGTTSGGFDRAPE